MILTIDTNRDSPEDIRKAIKALLAILGEGASHPTGSRNIFDSPSSSSGSDSAPASDGGNIFGNIFDNSGSGGAGSDSSSTPSSSEESPEVELY